MPGDPAVQALVRGNPDRFHADEARRRARGRASRSDRRSSASPATPSWKAALAALDPITMLTSADGDQTVCLLALDAGAVPAFGRAVRELAAREVVTRVEAEPHL